MNETNINIYLYGNTPSGSESDPLMPGVTPNPDAPEETAYGIKESANALTMTKAIGFKAGRQALSMVTSRVGVSTRNNLKQEQTNAALKGTGYGLTFFGSLATQNYLAAAVTAVSFIGDLYNSGMQYSDNAAREEGRLSILRRRYYGNIDRSR